MQSEAAVASVNQSEQTPMKAIRLDARCKRPGDGMAIVEACKCRGQTRGEAAAIGVSGEQDPKLVTFIDSYPRTSLLTSPPGAGGRPG